MSDIAWIRFYILCGFPNKNHLPLSLPVILLDTKMIFDNFSKLKWFGMEYFNLAIHALNSQEIILVVNSQEISLVASN